MSFYTILLMSACVTYIACITQVTLEVINYRHSSFTMGGFASFTFISLGSKHSAHTEFFLG